MKKALWMLIVVGGLVALPAHAADLSFTKFNSDITVNTDASISVVETMTVDFSSALHGIYRTIPFRFATENGGQASIPINLTDVQQDGQPVQYSTSSDGTNLKVKIGNPNKTIIGTHEYVVRYTAEAAANFFTDHDELYWNATGTVWDAPIMNISATVRLPGSFTFTQVTTTCFTGSYGATTQNCKQSHTGNSATFSADDYLTIVVGWPVGAVTKPENFDQLRAQGTVIPPNPAFQPPTLWALALNNLAVLAVFGLLFRHWWIHGRDPQQRKTIIAQYDPPDDLRPAELYAIMNEQAPMKLLLPATIVDLAVRGYLQIREVEKEKFLGLGHEKDYELQRMKPVDATLRTFEILILETLFEAKHVDTASQPTLKLSDLKKRKYTTNPFSPALKEVMNQMVSEKYFSGNPLTAKITVGVIGVALIGISVLLIISGVFAWGGILAGLIAFGFIPAMPQRSVKGAEAAWVGHGFRLFIDKAEQYRVKWQERENIFEKFLPYAMVFGLADKWSKALADVAKQPDWYSGSSTSTFNTMIFVGTMSSFGNQMNSSIVSAAASGSSGFGGGGFSGGGGGGGGGGGW